MNRSILVLSAASLALAGCQTVRERLPGRAPAHAVAATSPCVDSSFPIYFDEGSDRLTAAALQALSVAATPLKQCAIQEVVVIGLADASGSAAANQELSQKRAETVTKALAAQNLPTPTFQLAAGGEDQAATAQGQEPMRRRTEVVIRARPQPASPPPTS